MVVGRQGEECSGRAAKSVPFCPASSAGGSELPGQDLTTHLRGLETAARLFNMHCTPLPGLLSLLLPKGKSVTPLLAQVAPVKLMELLYMSNEITICIQAANP